jgi:hypothetical protein
VVPKKPLQKEETAMKKWQTLLVTAALSAGSIAPAVVLTSSPAFAWPDPTVSGDCTSWTVKETGPNHDWYSQIVRDPDYTGTYVVETMITHYWEIVDFGSGYPRGEAIKVLDDTSATGRSFTIKWVGDRIDVKYDVNGVEIGRHEALGIVLDSRTGDGVRDLSDCGPALPECPASSKWTTDNPKGWSKSYAEAGTVTVKVDGFDAYKGRDNVVQAFEWVQIQHVRGGEIIASKNSMDLQDNVLVAYMVPVSLTADVLPGDEMRVVHASQVASATDAGSLCVSVSESFTAMPIIVSSDYECVERSYDPANTAGFASWSVDRFGSYWTVKFGDDFYTNAETNSIDLPITPALTPGSYPWEVLNEEEVVASGSFEVVAGSEDDCVDIRPVVPTASVVEKQDCSGLYDIVGTLNRDGSEETFSYILNGGAPVVIEGDTFAINDVTKPYSLEVLVGALKGGSVPVTTNTILATDCPLPIIPKPTAAFTGIADCAGLISGTLTINRDGVKGLFGVVVNGGPFSLVEGTTLTITGVTSLNISVFDPFGKEVETTGISVKSSENCTTSKEEQPKEWETV